MPCARDPRCPSGCATSFHCAAAACTAGKGPMYLCRDGSGHHSRSCLHVHTGQCLALAASVSQRAGRLCGRHHSLYSQVSWPRWSNQSQNPIVAASGLQLPACIHRKAASVATSPPGSRPPSFSAFGCGPSSIRETEPCATEAGALFTGPRFGHHRAMAAVTKAEREEKKGGGKWGYGPC